MTTRDQFWAATETMRQETELFVAPAFAQLRLASWGTIRAVFEQYRFYTKSYASDLALLVHKLPVGKLRSIIAMILAEELGDGDQAHDHLALYDRFLCTIGCDERLLEVRALRENVALLDELRELLTRSSPAFGIGLRGMGGECLCAVYLLLLHKELKGNLYVERHASNIDWVFWDIHTGDIDEEHGVMTRAAVDEYMVQHPDEVDDLHAGYVKANAIWKQFWENVFHATGLRNSLRSGTDHHAAQPTAADR
jgi:hypothetical protein